MSGDRKHHVYVLFRSNGEPFYVGMGVRDRIDHHLHRRHRGRSHKNSIINATVEVIGDLPRVKIADGLTKDEAVLIERSLILAIGRKPNGPLVNMTDGGDGTFNLSSEVMAARNAKISATKRETVTRKPPKPRADPEITRQKRSEAAKTARQRPDVNERITAAIRVAVQLPENRIANSLRVQMMWDQTSQEDRDLHGKKMKVVLARPDVKARMRASSRQRWSNPSERERFREIGRRAATARWSR